MANEDATAVNDSAVQDSATTDSAPAEETKLEVVTEGPAIEPNDIREAETDDSAEDVADDTAESEAVDETETPQEEDKPLAPKSENRFQKLANENKMLKEQLAAREAQIAQEQELLNEINPETGDYYTPAEAERIARAEALQKQQQSLAQERTQLEVQQNVAQIATEAEQAAAVPMFREFNEDGTKNPDYVPQLAADYDSLLADNLLFQAQDGNVYTAATLLANGVDLQTQAQLVGSYNSPLKLATIVANAYKASAVPNQLKGQKATEKMLSAADNVSSAKPSKASAADEATMSPEEYAKAKGLEQVWQ